MVLGIVLAAAGLLASGGRPGGGLPADAAARVNGELVRMDDFEQTLRALASDRREGAGLPERRRALERLVDEELLVQRALELGLARHDARVRRDLASTVIDAVVAEHEDAEPSERELEAFYDEHRDFFSRPGRLRVRQVWCRVAGEEDDAAARARQAAARLRAGETIAEVREALGDREVAPLPDALLPAAKLLDYVGPTALRTALGLAVGEVSDPVRSGSGYHVLQLLEREAEWLPPLAEIAAEVRAEHRRRAGDRALRAYLDDLRARAEIELAPALASER
jgi:hypothetical protein